MDVPAARASPASSTSNVSYLIENKRTGLRQAHSRSEGLGCGPLVPVEDSGICDSSSGTGAYVSIGPFRNGQTRYQPASARQTRLRRSERRRSKGASPGPESGPEAGTWWCESGTGTEKDRRNGAKGGGWMYNRCWPGGKSEILVQDTPDRRDPSYDERCYSQIDSWCRVVTVAG